MISDAILWVSNPSLLTRRVGGMSVLERQLHTMSRAGLRRAWVCADQAAAPSAGQRLPQGLDVFWTNRAGAAPECRPPYLVVSGNHFIRIETLAHIVRHPGGRHNAFLDGRQTSVVQVVPARGEEMSPCHNQPLPEGASLPLQQALDDGPALDWLLEIGIKSQDGFMARHFDRHISLAISRALLDTPISPNWMTLLSCLVGLAGTAFFLIHSWSAHMAGAALVWLHSVLDGCDGELARIRFQESPLGSDIDFWGDNLVHISLFGCLAAGFAQADQNLLPLLAGLTATVGILGSAILVYRQRLARRGSLEAAGEPAEAPEAALESSAFNSRLARLHTILEQRDFIYLLVLLAYLGRTYEFLWAGAVGALLFFAMMLYLGRANHEHQFQPNSAG